MVGDLRAPYPSDPGPIGRARGGTFVALRPMSPEAARQLGTRLATIDPWARVGYDADSFVRFLAATEQGAARYRVMAGEGLVGAMVIRLQWLHGPYLHLLGLLPEAQGQGIGELTLRWMEEEARGRFRNLWLCVSAFNSRARHFYEAQGFTASATLDGLVFDGKSEILMRKRLSE
jgi:diamine N-acetyltransferase